VIEQLFSAEEISRRVNAIGGAIRAEAGNGEVFLLGILKGASVFLSDLLRAIDGAVTYGFIDVVRDEADTGVASALEIDFVSYTNISGRDVYVIKDIVSTGVIENYLLAQLRLHDPKSLHLVTLLDRPSLRTVDITVDFKAFETDGGSYVGYGLELDAHHGNLPFIGRIIDSR
jgi:hypoxanthine phosphoribosyltransferase